ATRDLPDRPPSAGPPGPSALAHKRALSTPLSQRTGPSTPVERIVKKLKPSTPVQKEAAKIESILEKVGIGLTPERLATIDKLVQLSLTSNIERFAWHLIQQCHDVTLSKKLAYQKTEMPPIDKEQIKKFGTQKMLTAIKNIVDRLPKEVSITYV
ncbi:hypothetical protein LTS15_010048, partial [Exophiala xenobiotica]